MSVSDRRRDRRLLVIAAVCLAGVSVGGVRAFTDRGGTEPAPPAVPVPAPPAAGAVAGTDPSGSTVTTPAAAGPSSREWGVPTGYVRTRAGARAAAVGWVSALGPLMDMGPIARNDTLTALLSERAAAETIEEFRGERERYIAEFAVDPSEAMWLESPLTVNVDRFDVSTSTVRVWSQLLVGLDGERVAVIWRTHTVTVMWERGDWRIDDVSRTPGPTPTPMDGELPSPAAEFDDATDWVPAVVAGSSVEGD